MLKAELGDFLYIIIFVILMLAGGIEKYVKAKKQQADRNPLPPQPRRPYDDFEDEDAEEPVPKHTQPQTLEDILKRMMQAPETPEVINETKTYPAEAQSLETIPVEPVKNYYQPLTNNMTSKLDGLAKSDYKPLTSDITSQLDGNALFSAGQAEENDGAVPIGESDFDIRKAVIASEILNRKY